MPFYIKRGKSRSAERELKLYFKIVSELMISDHDA